MAKKRAQEDVKKQPEWLELQQFFFRAMVGGYAGGGHWQRVPGKPGHKCFPYFELGSSLKLVDEYGTNRASRSFAGTTTIWLDGAPVWYMHYSGRYGEDATKLLKKALKYAYSRGLFQGGRGPASFNGRAEGMAYLNIPCHGDFSEFNGKERIIDSNDGRPFGWCDYGGGLM